MEENSSKELNLIDLIAMFFNWCKRMCKGFLCMCGNTLRLLCRNLVPTCIILVLSVLLGLYLGSGKRRVYKAEGMAVLNGSIAQTVKEVSYQLESSSSLAEFTTWSSKLALDSATLHGMRGLESFYVIDYLNDSTPDVIDFKGKHPLDDTLNVRMPNRLYFRMKVKDAKQVPAIQEGILGFFNSNERLRREFDVKRANLEGEVRLITDEINRIDSMATITYLSKPQMQVQLKWNTLLLGEQKRQMLYEDLLYLQRLKAKREAELGGCTAPVVMPTGFVVSPLPVHGRFFYLGLCGLGGVLAAVLLALLIENRKCIVHYLFGRD